MTQSLSQTEWPEPMGGLCDNTTVDFRAFLGRSRPLVQAMVNLESKWTAAEDIQIHNPPSRPRLTQQHPNQTSIVYHSARTSST
jgi:hypothetical protein